MIQHTMIVTFANPIPDADLDQFLTDIEQVMRDSGLVTSAAARRHISVPAEQQIDRPLAAAIVQFAVADAEALDASFAALAWTRSSAAGSPATPTRSCGPTTSRSEERRRPAITSGRPRRPSPRSPVRVRAA